MVVVVVKVVISSSPRLSALAAPLSTLLSPLSFFFPSPISGRLLSAGLWLSTHASRRKEQKTLGFSNPCEHLAVSRAPFERFERHIPPRVRSPQGEWRHEVLATPLSHRVQGLATIMVRAELLCPTLTTLDCSPSRHLLSLLGEVYTPPCSKPTRRVAPRGLADTSLIPCPRACDHHGACGASVSGTHDPRLLTITPPAISLLGEAYTPRVRSPHGEPGGEVLARLHSTHEHNS